MTLPRSLLLAAGAAAVAACAAAATASADYKTALYQVSINGSQVFTKTHVERPSPNNCFTSKGTTKSESRYYYAGSRVLMRVSGDTRSRNAPSFELENPTREYHHWQPLEAEVEAFGRTDRQQSRCSHLGGQLLFEPYREPMDQCGDRKIPGFGVSIGLDERPGFLRVTGDQRGRDTSDPLPQCAYGDHGYGLGRARVHAPARDLLHPDFRKHILHLTFKENRRDHKRDYTTTVVESGSAKVTMTRVGPVRTIRTGYGS